VADCTLIKITTNIDQRAPSLFRPQVLRLSLVIDDDAAMRTILNCSLMALGYLILAASDGDEALQIARAHPEIRLIHA